MLSLNSVENDIDMTFKGPLLSKEVHNPLQSGIFTMAIKGLKFMCERISFIGSPPSDGET